MIFESYILVKLIMIYLEKSYKFFNLNELFE